MPVKAAKKKNKHVVKSVAKSKHIAKLKSPDAEKRVINEEEEEAYDAETDSEVVGEQRNSDIDKSAAVTESRPKRIRKKRESHA